MSSIADVQPIPRTVPSFREKVDQPIVYSIRYVKQSNIIIIIKAKQYFEVMLHNGLYQMLY